MGLNRRIRNERKRQRLIALSLVLVVCVGAYLLSTLYDFNSRLKVTFVTPDGGQREDYLLEVADTPAARTKGLMYRKKLDRRGGMIFIDDHDEVQKFWMQNTYVSLDMIFVNNDRRVVGILDSVPILNTEPRFVDQPSRYVIELPAGTARKDGIVVGSRVEFKYP